MKSLKVTKNKIDKKAEAELEIYSAPFAAKFPKVPPEIIRAWLTKIYENLQIPAKENESEVAVFYEDIEPEFLYTVSTPALEGDNPMQIFEGRYEVGNYNDIGEAEGAAQILYFLGREARIDCGEFSE